MTPASVPAPVSALRQLLDALDDEAGLRMSPRLAHAWSEGRESLWAVPASVPEDNAIHILYPGNTTLTLCGHTDRANRQPIVDPWPDSWAGCWTCLNEAEKIAERPA